MLGPVASWWLLFALGAVLGGWTLVKHRPNLAVGACAALALLCPTWVTIGSVPYVFDLRMALACLMMIAYCFHPQGTLRYPQHWLDAVVLGLIVVHIFADLSKGGSLAAVPLRAVGEWSIPFLAGRCSVLFKGSVAWLAPWFSGAAVILGLGAIIESYFGLNLWEWLFFPMDDLVQRSREPRYDLIYRAVGPTRHPIFLAIVFLLLVPWPIALMEQKESRVKRALGWVALAMIVLGMMATVSRGPLVGLAIAGVAAACLRWPRTRPFVLIGGVAIMAGAFFFSGELIQWMEKTDTRGAGHGKLVELNNEGVVYTDTRNRLFVWKIYGPLVVRAGLFGYGTQAVSSFPPNIPGLPPSARAAETLGIVDNSYLLFGLRFGWIGLALLIALLGGAIVTAISHRRVAGIVFYPYGAAFLTALASVLIGVAPEIATVFFSYEFAYWILFHCGVVTGLASCHQRLLRGADT